MLQFQLQGYTDCLVLKQQYDVAGEEAVISLSTTLFPQAFTAPTSIGPSLIDLFLIIYNVSSSLYDTPILL